MLIQSSFTQLIIANLQARTLAAKSPRLAEALMSIRAGPSAPANTIANELPSPAEAIELIRSYMFGHHILCPLLSRSQIIGLYRNIYESCGPDSASCQEHASASSQDLFQLNMIFAISAVNLVYRGLHHSPPLGYYVSAMHHFKTIPKMLGLEAARNLLFLGEFTLLQDTGCSVWDIARICVRTCLLLDLHQEHPFTDEEVANDRRLVFWESYSLDRLASMTLGRPFSISDRDITAQVGTSWSDKMKRSHALVY